MSEKNVATAHRWHNEMFVEGKLDLVDEIINPDFVGHGTIFPPELPGGREGIKQLTSALLANMSDISINHHETVSQGDYVMIRWDFAFNHTGEVFGVPATGKRISGITGMDLFRFENGQIAEFWQDADWLGMLQQMGAAPG